jgi:hypothetical protein
MAATFTALIMRLASLRTQLAGTLRSKGVDALDADTLAVLFGKTALIDSTSGLNQIRNGYQLFRGNTTLTRFPEFDTSVFDSMYQMCYGCTALASVPVLETTRVTNMMYAFYGCSALVEIGGLDTSQITSASELFHGCKSLRKIGGVLDFSRVRSQIDSTFVSCAALEEVTFAGTIGVDIAMNGCPKLTVASLLSLLNALASGVTGLTCNIGAKNLAKLTTAQQAIATGKGWVLT